MTSNRLNHFFAPVTTITIAAVLAVSLAVASVMLALSGPWLGVVFDRTYDGAGVRVKQVTEHSPADGKLKAGDIIKAFVTPAHGRVEVLSKAILEDPGLLASYAEYNAFFAHQQSLYEAITAPTFSAVLSSGRKVELSSAAYPGPATLPTTF